jgi:glycolate oxidase iron-sulfur subunit
MQTLFTLAQLADPQVAESEKILRSCVHCGFCTATCPTYQLLGDELDGPRGRIYLMKELVEGGKVSKKTQLHLDRCLTCRACETTCPSGVQYGRLVDIGRKIVEKEVGRGFGESLLRSTLKTVIANPALFNPLLRLGQLTKPLLPAALARKVPPRVSPTPWPAPRHARRMLVLQGCVRRPQIEERNRLGWSGRRMSHTVRVKLIVSALGTLAGVGSRSRAAPRPSMSDLSR